MSADSMWRFGPFRLDPINMCLWRDTEILPLRPKPFAVLAYLVAHAGQVVHKDTLLEEVWPEAVVSEGVLKDYINQIRKTLSDTARAPQYIATVHRRGYRFVAPVTRFESPPVVPPTPSLPRPKADVVPRVGPGAFSTAALVVEREVELAQLQQWWDNAQQGQRQLGFIAGEAGVGKTALIDTFVAQLGDEQAVWIGHGQCIEIYGAGEPYLPLLEAFGRLGRAADGERLVRVLRQVAPGWFAQLPALWTGPDSTLGQGQRVPRGRMLRELAEAVEVLTADHPLILLLEDLHWSDTSTLEWLAYIARRRGPARLLVLGTYRPVDAIRREHSLRTVVAELQRHRLGQELLIHYLSLAGVAAYLTWRFASKVYPRELAPLLHQRTNGNPLFLVTAVDDMVRRGVLAEQATHVIVQDDMAAVATGVPETLRHLIEQQLEQINPADRELLETASVAGMVFAAASVAAGMAATVDEVEQRCAVLARQQQFIQAYGTAEWPDGTLTARYSFRHAFYHEVCYQRLPIGLKSQRHRQIGLRLEGGYSSQAGEIAAELAMHFEYGREAPRAVQYLQQAAQHARRRSAHREAVHYYERALQALQHFPPQDDTRAQVIDLHLELRNALVPLGELGRILTHLRTAETLAHAVGDVRAQGRIAAYLTRDLHMMGHHTEAVASGARALTIVQEDVALRVTSHLYLSYAYYALGEYQRAVEILRPEVAGLTGTLAREALGLAALPSVSTRVSIVYNLTELGAFPEGIALGSEALEIAEDSGQPFSLTQAYRGLGMLYLQQGQLDRAIPLLERGLSLCREADLPLAFPTVASYLGTAYAQAGRIEEALPLLEQALAQGALIQLGDRQTLCMILLGSGYLRAGRLQDTLSLAQEALALARERMERGVEAYALHLLGALAAAGTAPDVAQAETCYQQARTLAQHLSMRPLLAHTTLGLGALYQQTGQWAQAHTARSAAIALFDAMGMTFWRTQAHATLSQQAVS